MKPPRPSPSRRPPAAPRAGALLPRSSRGLLLLALLPALGASLRSQEPESRPARRAPENPRTTSEPASRPGRGKPEITAERLGEAIERALLWLARHQRDDGRWAAAGFLELCPKGRSCGGPGNPMNDVGVTGLACLALLGNGTTLRYGTHKDSLRRAVDWLRKQQGEDGLLGAASGATYLYSHTIATTALSRAYWKSRYRPLKAACRRAVRFIEDARNPKRVWRYFPRSGENDSSMTAWMTTALLEAKSSRLEVDPKALEAAASWFRSVTDPRTGRVGYTKLGEVSSRDPARQRLFPASSTEALTAAGAFCRIALGGDPKKEADLETGLRTVRALEPAWDPKGGGLDFYYWYFGMRLVRLPEVRMRNWRRALCRTLLEAQREDGHAEGSFDPAGAWGDQGGRIYATALALLCFGMARDDLEEDENR